MKVLKRSDARQFIIDEANGIFSVVFIKKDKSVREMVCRLGVQKDLKGIGHSFDPEEKNLLCVYDMGLAKTGKTIDGEPLEGQPYRFINVNTLIKVKMNGEEYIVEEFIKD